MNGERALKLDLTYRPIEVIDALEALVLCIVGKAIAVENYEREIRSPSVSFKLPAVIVLRRVVQYRPTGLSCNRENILWRDQNVCQYCAKRFRGIHLTLDHVHPRSRGGKNTWKNLVTSCMKCNQKKGDRTPAEANMFPIREPYHPKFSVLKCLTPSQILDVWKDYLW
tara:strand:- start:331 stop:834 length:504 start_codon:yes stop_codon:yes gene_type:complete